MAVIEIETQVTDRTGHGVSGRSVLRDDSEIWELLLIAVAPVDDLQFV
jgi:hypothetical protein